LIDATVNSIGTSAAVVEPSGDVREGLERQLVSSTGLPPVARGGHPVEVSANEQSIDDMHAPNASTADREEELPAEESLTARGKWAEVAWGLWDSVREDQTISFRCGSCGQERLWYTQPPAVAGHEFLVSVYFVSVYAAYSRNNGSTLHILVVIMALFWLYHEFIIMALLWLNNGIVMALFWLYYGFTMAELWLYYGLYWLYFGFIMHQFMMA
jgi:hypothetical protein